MPVTTGPQRNPGLPETGSIGLARVIRRQMPSFAGRGVPAPRWWPLLQESPALAPLRRDAHDNLLRIAWALALAARADGTAAPTWEGLSEQVGLSRATIARHLAWLQRHGFLAVKETGSTPKTRGGRAAGEGNHSAIYALTVPSAPSSVEESETPPCSLVERTPYTRARTTETGQAASGGGTWNSHQVARTGAERLKAAEATQQRVLVLRRKSPKAVRSALRTWLVAGWTVSDIVWALDHDPDGKNRWQTGHIANPLGWLRARLKPWEGLPPPSQIKSEERAALRAAQLEERARREAERTEAVPMPAGFRDLLHKRG